jgi:hypothetical protein
MKLLTTKFSPAPGYFIPLCSNYSTTTLFLNTLSLCSSLNIRDQVLGPKENKIKMMKIA